MTGAGKAVAILFACFTPLLLASCDAGRSYKVEVLSGSGPGKTRIRAAASDEAYVHFLKLADAYSRKHNVQFEISRIQGRFIPGLLEKGTMDLGATARRYAAEELGSRLSYIPFAYDGAVFLASPDAKVRSLTLSQLRNIFQGRITNWKEVGGADREIRIIGRPPYSAVNLSIGAALFGGEFPGSKREMIMETSESVFHAMKTVPSHLAYAPISRVTMEPFPSVPMTVDRMPPLIGNVPAANYPAKVEYSLLVPKDAGAAVTEFADYLQSVEAMHMLASLSLIPAAGKLSLSSCHCRATEGTFSPIRGSSLAGTFTIAVVPELGAGEQENRYVGISRIVANELGVRTRLTHLETYERVIDEFEGGRIDAAFVDGLAYGQLRERMKVVPLARPESGKVSRYRDVLIVRADSGIPDFRGLRGKSFAYVPGTSSGELFYRMMLKRQGSSEREFFSRAVKASTHSDAVRMVVEGKVDGAAVKDMVLDRWIEERGKNGFPGLKDAVRIVESSPFLPENTLVVGPSIDPKQSVKLRDIFLSMHERETGRTALRVLGADRFVPTAHDDYEKLSQMARESGYSFRKK